MTNPAASPLLPGCVETQKHRISKPLSDEAAQALGLRLSDVEEERPGVWRHWSYVYVMSNDESARKRGGTLRLSEPLPDEAAASLRVRLADVVEDDDGAWKYEYGAFGGATGAVAVDLTAAPRADMKRDSGASAFVDLTVAPRADMKRVRDSGVHDILGLFSQDALKEVCKKLKVGVSGNKTELVARILDAER